MKNSLFFLLLIATLASCAQDKDEVTILANTRSLHNTVFGTKDSAEINRLFGKEVTYGHSGGKIETREEALHNIVHNKAEYKNLAMVNGIQLQKNGNTAVTRHIMTCDVVNADGTPGTPLKLMIVLVWVKEKGDWKLMCRQAAKMP